MRTLKKTLALVLVVAMALSFGVIGATAAFTDTKDSDYTEAIDVMSGIGVINGMTATTFAPEGNLTREQAAKIVAYMMLGPTNAQLISTATSQKFTDVAKDRWSAGYIEYCANVGIIAGVGDNKFDPEGILSTAAFTKMLLVSLGYKADVEQYVGASWAINVASAAVKAGVYDKTITISASTACTREQACQLAYKTLTAKMVEYVGGSTMTVGGVSVVVGATRGFVSGSEDSGYFADKDNDGYVQFCEDHFSDLKLHGESSDSFARPGHKWVNKKTTIGTYTVAAEDVFTDDSYVKEFADYDFEADVVIKVNGEEVEGLSTVATLKARAYNGTGIELYDTDDDDEIDLIVVVQSYLTKISGFKATKGTKAGTFNLTVYNPWAGSDAVSFTVTDNLKSSTDMYDKLVAAGCEKDDFLLTYFKAADVSDGSSLLKFEDVETEVGTLTSYSATDEDDGFNGTVTVGGTKYTLASGCAEHDSFVNYSDLNSYLGKEVLLYLDANGMVMGITTEADATAVTNYAYVLAAGVDSTWDNSSFKAKLLYTDGTVATVVTDKDYSAEANDYENDIVTYKTVSGKVELTTKAETAAPGSLTLTKGVAKFTVGSTPYYANAKTVFVVKTGTDTDPVYTAYVGIANVPSLKAASGATVAVYDEDSIAKVVYIASAPEASSTGATFVAGYEGASEVAEYVNGSIVTYYVYDAVIDGEITTVKLADECEESVLNTGISYANGVGTLSGDEPENIAKANKTVAVSNGLLKVNTVYYTCTSDCAVFVADGGEISESSLDTIETDGNDDIIVTLNASGVVTAVYITVNA